MTEDTNEMLVEEPIADQSEWGLDDTPDNAPAAPVAEPETFRLKHLGQEFEVTRDEVTALAQKGRDYDRIRERLLSLETQSGATPRVMREVHDFVAEYGATVDAAQIPAAVWNEVQAGSTLLAAYQRHENNSLRALIRNEENRSRSFGVRGNSTARSAHGELESDWYE